MRCATLVLTDRYVRRDSGRRIGGAAECLRHRAGELVAGLRRERRGDAGLGVLRLVLHEPIEPDVAGRLLPRDVAILAPLAHAGSREPVMEERRVLAAIDRPEERVA